MNLEPDEVTSDASIHFNMFKDAGIPKDKIGVGALLDSDDPEDCQVCIRSKADGSTKYVNLTPEKARAFAYQIIKTVNEIEEHTSRLKP